MRHTRENFDVMMFIRGKAYILKTAWRFHSMLSFDAPWSISIMSPGEKSVYLFNNAHVVNDSDRHTLLQEASYTHQRCISRRWKLLLWIGVILLVLGTLAIVVSYLIPSVEWITTSANLGDDVQIYDKLKECNIISYLCKVIGFLIFCIGGVLLTISLLFSSCIICSYNDRTDDMVADVSLNCIDRIDEPDHRAQKICPASCTIQDALASEMLNQQINIEALSATLI